MASYNKVMLMGNLTRDPELRYTPKGSAVADLGLAVSRTYTAENGERREEVTFVDVVLWARQAEVAGQYLKKGSPVFIEGRLQMDTWDDKQTGQKRSKIKVVGEFMQMIGRRGESGDGGDEEGGARGGGSAGGGYQQRPASRPPSASSSRPPSNARPPQPANEEFSEGPITEGLVDDDIPF
ncbi:MAG: single-stranded DNA-binding protein [Roseimicrobium sp.]